MGELMPECPRCQSPEKQVKAGRNRGGSQRYLCRECGRYHTPRPSPAGYDEAVRTQALRCYAGGTGVRAAARYLGVNHQTVANWVGEACARAGAGGEAGGLDAQVVSRRETGRLEREYLRLEAGRSRGGLRFKTFGDILKRVEGR
jgi:transposase-like protein